MRLLSFIAAIALTSVCFAEESPSSNVIPIAEVKNEAINLENLPKESVTGALSGVVTEEETILDCLEDRIKRRPMLYPYSEGLAYVNGFLCHVGNYPQSIIYTALDGPQYGMQTVTNLYGGVLYVNYEYELEYTPYGVILHHYYYDSKIITGSTQVISFY